MKAELLEVLKKYRHTMVSDEFIVDEQFKLSEVVKFRKRKELNELDLELRQSKLFCEQIPKPNIDSQG